MRKFSGVLMPRVKNTAAAAPQAIPTPTEVRLPLATRPGGPQATVIVKVGEDVKVGQLIGEAAEDGSSPVHSSVSGTVKGIETMDSLTGEKSATITITSDGNQTLWEGIAPVRINTADDFLKAVVNSGVVAFGNEGDAGASTTDYSDAGTYSLEKYNKLEYLLINCLETEPYVTSSARAVIDDTEYVQEGIKLLKFYLSPRNLVICVGKNNGEALEKMKQFAASMLSVEPGAASGIKVSAFNHLYPQGQKHVLVRNVTGRIVPEGKSF